MGKDRRGGDAVWNQSLRETNYRWEGRHKHREGKGAHPTPATTDTGTALGKQGPITLDFENQ